MDEAGLEHERCQTNLDYTCRCKESESAGSEVGKLVAKSCSNATTLDTKIGHPRQRP